MPTPHGMSVLGCVCPSDAFAGGSPSLGLFSPSQRQKVSNPKNGAVHLPAPAHRHVDTVHVSDPRCIGLPIKLIQLNSTAVTAFDCLKNTLPTTHCGVLNTVLTSFQSHVRFAPLRAFSEKQRVQQMPASTEIHFWVQVCAAMNDVRTQ